MNNRTRTADKAQNKRKAYFSVRQLLESLESRVFFDTSPISVTISVSEMREA
jgi:hypothetical protein